MNVTDTQQDIARQQEPRYAPSLGGSRAAIKRNLILVVDPVDELSIVVDVESSYRSAVYSYCSSSAELAVSTIDSLRPQLIFS